MSNVYFMSRSNIALSTTADSLTIISAANRRLYVIEIEIAGMGTASAANELLVARSTGGVTGGGALTPGKRITDSPAQSFTNFTTWTTQPTLSDSLLRLGVNANGGINRWVARPGQEIELRNSEQLSLRSALGTSNISFQVIVEEF